MDNIGEISRSLSKAKIEDAITAPTITTLAQECGPGAILSILLFELEKINAMFNSNPALKLTHDQCADLAVMLFDEFPHESLEDFVLAFRRGITGRYNEKLLRLDVQIIFGWVRAFLGEKAELTEKLHKITHEPVARIAQTAEERQKIDELIQKSWVGEALRSQVSDAEQYRKFRADYLVRKAAASEVRKETAPPIQELPPDEKV